MTRPDPTDKELLEFVARFVGWDSIEYTILGKPMESTSGRLIPDYLNSVDAWLRDVWPKVEAQPMLGCLWMAELERIITHGPIRQVNADARSRCLALYRALP